jgi:methylated-DNA-[protein]-cysteine S-methyltransferase
MTMPSLSLHSPLGPLTIVEDDGAIAAIDWGWSRETEETGLLALARDQLVDYFDGTRRGFSLPLSPMGTAFQKSVWARMMRIPYGGTESYAALARALGSSARAVGTACGANPIPVLIPCHRVVGAGGRLTGYSGGDGLATKRYLLQHEGAVAAPAEWGNLAFAF